MFYLSYHDTATTEIYTLSLHDALPIFAVRPRIAFGLDEAKSMKSATRWIFALSTLAIALFGCGADMPPAAPPDRKSTRLNSSHSSISYAVFCLKKKKNNPILRHVLKQH